MDLPLHAGLQTGDQIQSVDGAKCQHGIDVQENIQKNPGKEIEFVVVRDGENIRYSSCSKRN